MSDNHEADTNISAESEAPSDELEAVLPQYRIVEGTSPALEWECPPQTIIMAAKGAFLAKSPKIAVTPSDSDNAIDLYQNTADDTEILYLSPSSTGSLIAFDMGLHRGGLIISVASLFAATQDIILDAILDITLAGITGDYRLYKTSGEGIIVAFMSGDLFPITLSDDADCLQIDARALAAMEPSVAFELEQLSNGQYVATLCGPGRVWLQSMPTQ